VVQKLEIHKFKVANKMYLLDVNAGSLLKIDQLILDILDLYNDFSREEIILTLQAKYDKQQIEDGLAELEELIKEGVLLDQKNQSPNEMCSVKGDVIKALCLHIAHDCNLRCSYCFACEGNFGGTAGLMSVETGKAALDFLLAHSGKRHNCEVDFFGGEPLLNFSVLKEIVEYGKRIGHQRGKNIRFTLTTNAILLDQEVQDYLNKEGFSVVLSLDGRKETNDRMRVDKGNNGTYERIVERIVPFVEGRNHTNYYVRGTYTRYNLDFGADVAHLVNLGFKQISVEPVIGSVEQDYALREDDLPKIYAEYERLSQLYLELYDTDKEFSFFHFNINLDQGPCLPRRLVGCGAGYEYVAVTPEGDIYPCHQFVGRKEFRLGSVFTGIENPAIREEFKNANIYTKEGCAECWARYYCSGGCHANAHLFNGSILKPDQLSCSIMKKRLECALAVQGELLERSMRKYN